jgi:hypothetical protein
MKPPAGNKKKKKKGVAVDEDLFTGDVGVLASFERRIIACVGLVKAILSQKLVSRGRFQQVVKESLCITLIFKW